MTSDPYTRTALPLLLALGVGSATMSLPVASATVWDEALHGDLSTLAATPGSLGLSAGSNVIRGTVQAPGDTRDFVTFTLAPEQRLTALLLLEYVDETTGTAGNRGFHAINAGTQGFVPGPASAVSFLGGAHLDAAASGTDLLPGLADAALAGSGFVTPLGAGSYTYVIQQTGPQLTRYALDFQVAVVPAPAAGLLLAPALGLLALLRHRAG